MLVVGRPAMDFLEWIKSYGECVAGAWEEKSVVGVHQQTKMMLMAAVADDVFIDVDDDAASTS